MWRKKEDLPQDVESTIQRLRDDRPQASPLELDQIKTSAMSRAGAKLRRTSTSRRLVASGLTVGLMAAGTGGVIAAGSSSSSGDAASAQYSTTTTQVGGVTINGSGDTVITCLIGSVGGNLTCTINYGGTSTVTSTVTSAAVTSTVTSAAVTSSSTSAATTTTGSGGVLGASTTKSATKKVLARTSKRALVIKDIGVPKGIKLATETITINGKAYKFFLSGKSAVPISFAGVPCSNGTQVVKIVSVSTTGKVYSAKRTFHLCIPGA